MAALQGALSPLVAGIVAMSWRSMTYPSTNEYECSRGSNTSISRWHPLGNAGELEAVTRLPIRSPHLDDSVLNSMAPTLFLHGIEDTTVPSEIFP
jgi:hypothetical protein